MTEDQMVKELNKVEETTRTETVKSILVDLADFLANADPSERAGLALAMDIIKSNY